MSDDTRRKPVPPWFRMYHEVLHDPKVQQLTPYDFKAWVNLLCVAAKHEPRGMLPDIKTIAYELDTRKPRAVELLERLKAAGLVDQLDDGSYCMHAWEKRQYDSDYTTPRVQKSREGKRASQVLPDVQENASSVPADVQHSASSGTAVVQRHTIAVHTESGIQAPSGHIWNVTETPPDTEADTEADTEVSAKATYTTNTNSTGSREKAAATTSTATPTRPTPTRPAAIFPKGVDISFASMWLEQHDLPRPTRGMKSIATVLDEYKDSVNFNIEGALMASWLQKPKNANKTFDASFIRNWFDTAIKRQEEQKTNAARDSHANTSTSATPTDLTEEQKQDIAWFGRKQIVVN